MLTVKAVIRHLRRRLWPSSMVIATVAVCAASLTIGYIVTEPMLRGLPYAHSEELYVAVEKLPDGKLAASLTLDSMALVERLPVNGHAEARPVSGVTTTVAGATEELRAAEVSESLLPLLAVGTFLGDAKHAHGLPGTAPSVVVTFGFWKRVLASRPDPIGAAFSTSAGECVVAAVLPRSFVFPWTGRVQPEVLFVTPAVMGSGAAFVRVPPNRRPSSSVLGSVALLPINDYLLGSFAGAANAILVGFGVLALALTTTLYLLFLVLQIPRRRTEDLLVVLGRPARSAAVERGVEIGLLTTCGLIPAYWLVAFGTATLIEQIPQREILRNAIGLSPVAFFWGFGATVAAAVLAYSAATMSAFRRVRSIGLLSRPSGTRTLSMIASAQVALAVTLLTVGVALARSVLPMVTRDLGFDPNGLYISDPTGPSGLTSNTERYDYMFGVMDRLRRHNGVVGIAAIDSFPPSGALPDRALLTQPGLVREARGAVWRVTPNYFSVMRMTLTSGRTFTDAEVASGEPVCVLTSSAASRLGGGESSIGTSVAYDRTRCRAVGIVQDALDSLRGTGWWGIYMPFDRQTFRRLTIVTRTSADPAATVAAATAAYRTPERQIPSRTVSVRSLLAARVGELGLLTACLEVATLIVICLSLGGTYGIAAAQLSAHRQLHAVQLALGARYRELLFSFWRRISWPIARGALIGGVVGLQYQTYVASLMTDVMPLRTSHLFWACAALGLTAMLGSILIARSATRIDLRAQLDQHSGIR
jgi:MacB-like periplasmic core domain